MLYEFKDLKGQIANDIVLYDLEQNATGSFDAVKLLYETLVSCSLFDLRDGGMHSLDFRIEELVGGEYEGNTLIAVVNVRLPTKKEPFRIIFDYCVRYEFETKDDFVNEIIELENKAQEIIEFFKFY